MHAISTTIGVGRQLQNACKKRKAATSKDRSGALKNE